MNNYVDRSQKNVENKVFQFVRSPISTLKIDQVEKFKYKVGIKSDNWRLKHPFCKHDRYDNTKYDSTHLI